MKTTILRSLLLLAAAATSSACGIALPLLGRAFGPPAPPPRWNGDDVAGAERAGDAGTLEAMCENRRESPPTDLGAWNESCRAFVRVADARGDGELLRSICAGRRQLRSGADLACASVRRTAGARFAAASERCADLLAAWEEARSAMPADDLPALQLEAGLKAARCGLWEAFFSEFVPAGDLSPGAWGVRLLLAAESEGLDVKGALLARLRSGAPLSKESETRAVSHVASWLLASGHEDLCEEVAPAAARASDDALGAWLHYLAEARCHEAAPFAEARLASDDPYERLQACHVLGRVGAPRHARKLAILAESDPVFEAGVVDGAVVRVWPVREACRAAAGRIALRD